MKGLDPHQAHGPDGASPSRTQDSAATLDKTLSCWLSIR